MTVMSPEEDLTRKMGAVQVMSEDDVRAASQVMDTSEAGFGALTSERGNFPLRAVKVSARLSDVCSHMTLDQTFLNAFDTPLEATYIFPLPPQAAVTSFRFEVKNRVVEGVIKERGEAHQEYAQAVQEGHRAAIVEEERQGVFTVRVGNIGAGETASVRLTMAAPIPVSDGEATFRFPLLVAPRYIPGVRLPGADVGVGSVPDTNEAPDASRITPPEGVILPGFLDPVQLSIEVEFDVTSLPVSNVRCSLHTITVSDIQTNDSQDATSPPIAIRRLRLDPATDARLDRDFILRFNVTVPDHVAASLILSDDADSDSQEGTWQLTLVAPKGVKNGAVTNPRDVVFVIDRSGSMAGWKMVAARSAAARVVDTLSDADRFTVLAFDDRLECPFDTSASSCATSAPNGFPAPPAFRPPTLFSGGLFGQSLASPQTGGVFGPPPSTGVFGAPPSGGSLFGSVFGNNSPSSGGIFGTNSVSSGGVFGDNALSSGGLFGNPAPSSSIFGNPPSTAPSYGTWFSASIPNPPPPSGSIFGGPPSTGSGLLGGSSYGSVSIPPPPSLFAPSPNGSVFGQPNPSNFNQTPVALVAANYANRQRARSFLATLSARGGTDMAGPLTRAADALKGLEVSAPVEGSGGFWPPRGGANIRDRVLVLVTDGQVGNEDWIMGQLAPKMQGIRVFTLGIDQSVNETFLRRLSGLSPGGACELVESQGRLVYAMDRIHRLIATPVLSDIQIDGPQGTIPETVTPSRIPGLFPGVPVVVSGRYRKVPESVSTFVTVSGKTAAGENGTEIVRAREKPTAAASALWARAHICDLDDRFAIAAAPRVFGASPLKPENPDELRARILETSLRFQVLSRFTAFVAVDRTEKLPSTAGEVTRVVQPVEAPAGWHSSAAVNPTQLFGQASNPSWNPPSGFGQTQNPAFGAVPAPTRISPAFGASSHSGFGASSCPAFGATPQQPLPAASQPGFGGPSHSRFGGASHSGFGAPSQCSAFGGPPNSGFSAPSRSSQPNFGAASHSGFGGFGASSHSAFGGPTMNIQGAPALSTFGASASNFGSSSFGAVSHSSFGACSQLAFGSGTSPFGGSSSPSLFGADSHSAFGRSPFSSVGAPSQSAFGGSGFSSFGPAPSQSTSGAFSHSAFGAPSSSAFGVSTGSAFGATPSSLAFNFSSYLNPGGKVSGPSSSGAVSDCSSGPSWGLSSLFTTSPEPPAIPFNIFGAASGAFASASSAPGYSTGVFGAAPSAPGSSTGVFGAALGGSPGVFGEGLSGTGSIGGAPNPGVSQPAATTQPTENWVTGPCALTGFAIPLPDSDSVPSAPDGGGCTLPPVAGVWDLASACLGNLNALKADETSEKRGRLLSMLQELKGRLEGEDKAWVGEAILRLENVDEARKPDASFFEALEMILNRIKQPGIVAPY